MQQKTLPTVATVREEFRRRFLPAAVILAYSPVENLKVVSRMWWKFPIGGLRAG